MKIRALALLLFFTLSPKARADQLGALAQQVAQEVSSSERFLSPAQKGDVARHLEQIRNILNGHQPQPTNPYVCASRDNDGARPFVIGYKDFATVVRIQGTTHATQESCEQAIAGGRRIFNRLFLCGSRDNDGSRPYAVLALNGKEPLVKLQSAVTQSIDECQTIVRTMQVRPEGVLYCASRDSDGSHPFVKIGYRFNGSFERGNEYYTSLAECIQSL